MEWTSSLVSSSSEDVDEADEEELEEVETGRLTEVWVEVVVSVTFRSGFGAVSPSEDDEDDEDEIETRLRFLFRVRLGGIDSSVTASPPSH